MPKKYVIIGGDAAGMSAASKIRRMQPDSELVVFEKGQHISFAACGIPYWISDVIEDGSKLQVLTPEIAREKRGIDVRIGHEVTQIDATSNTIAVNNLETGEKIHEAYDVLLIATGARAVVPPIPGVGHDGVFTLRSLADGQRIKNYIAEHEIKHATIIGGGYIGLETAAALRKQGMDVTVLEMMERVLQRVTAPEISEFYDRVHKEEGVKICCGVGVASFAGNTNVEKVICSNGDEYAADLVVVGVGIVPNVELADAAGLEVNNGIVVDQFARTSDHDIVAAGDCTNHHNVLYDINIRLESVQNATDQARVAAQTLCGKEKAYDALPWFWSDQYDLKLQIAGLSQGYDEVIVRGDRDNSRSFAAFYLRGGVVIAVDAVNKAPEFMVGKRLITGKVAVDKMQLADENIPIKELLT